MEGKRILILEDDPILQLLYKKLLPEYTTTIVGTVTKALEVMKHDEFDLHILDLIINGSNEGGLFVAKLAVNPVIIVSAVKLDVSQMEHFKYYLRKPFKNSDLKAKIKEALNDETN